MSMSQTEKNLDNLLIDILSAIKDISVNVALNTQAIKTFNEKVDANVDSKITKLELKYAFLIISLLFCSGMFLVRVTIPKMIDELVPIVTQKIINKSQINKSQNEQ